MTNRSGSGGVREGRAGWVLFALTLAYVFNLLDRSIIFILQEDIKAEFGLADWQLGLLGGAAFGLFYSTMAIPIARFSEGRSRVNLLKICVVLWSGLTMLCGAAMGFVSLLLARIGVAVGEAGGSPLSHSILADHYPADKRTTALSIYTLAVPIGLLLGSAFGGFLADQFGWRWAFVIVGAPGLLVAVLIHFLVPEPKRGRMDVQTGEAPAKAPSLRQVFTDMMRDRYLVMVLAASSVAAFAAWGVTSFMAVWFLRRFDIDTQTVGLIYALIYGVATALGTWGGGVLNDRLARSDHRWRMNLPALCLIAAGPLYVAGLLVGAPWIAALALCVPALLSNAHYGATFSAVNNAVGAQSRTTAVSIMFLCHAVIGLSLGPLFTGLMSDVFARADIDLLNVGGGAAGLTGAMATTAIIFVLAGVLFAWAARRKPAENTERAA